MADNRLKIGITQGDTNGIGWELILKIFSDSRITELCTPIIYGSSKIAEEYKKLIEAAPLTFNIIPSSREAKQDKVNLVECGTIAGSITPGVAAPEAGLAAVEALQRATEELKAGVIDAIVTAPFNKESVQSDSFSFTGHTEYMASQFDGDSMMMMCSDILRVGLVTKHIPLSKIGETLSTEKIVGDLKNLRLSLKKDFGIIEPRIAVLALNPHAGEGGMLGGEEQEILQPAIQQAYKEGILAFGPFAADGFFAASTYKKYDAVLAMYHDQGLIPFKTLSPEGVNFTAGLLAVRCSPDHGVAYDIAGKGVATPDSMRNALYMAIDIVRARRSYFKASVNPLQRAERERSNRDMSLKDLRHHDNHGHHGHHERH
ncbi:MAG: 4-hydroxythreonine-4-phosphate dehydrogenase PdxA [Rikenellaceae bacterium]